MELYDRAEKAYNLGRFQEAISLFEEAYREESAPIFLFNIAQAYRLYGDCERALFFYKRFLGVDPQTKLRAEVEGRIRALEPRCAEKKTPAITQTATHSASKDPVPIAKPPTREATNEQPRSWAWSVAGGLAFPSFGQLNIPAEPSVRLAFAHAIRLNNAFQLEPNLSITSLWLRPGDEKIWTMTVAGGLALKYEPLPGLSIGPNIGAGMFTMFELEPGNSFTVGGVRATGPLTMFHAQAGIEADYGFNDWIGLAIWPFTLSVSPPKHGLRDDIKIITRIEALIGLRGSW